jgi:hypothetical protein
LCALSSIVPKWDISPVAFLRRAIDEHGKKYRWLNMDLASESEFVCLALGKTSSVVEALA